MRAPRTPVAHSWRGSAGTRAVPDLHKLMSYSPLAILQGVESTQGEQAEMSEYGPAGWYPQDDGERAVLGRADVDRAPPDTARQTPARTRRRAASDRGCVTQRLALPG